MLTKTQRDVLYKKKVVLGCKITYILLINENTTGMPDLKLIHIGVFVTDRVHVVGSLLRGIWLALFRS